MGSAHHLIQARKGAGEHLVSGASLRLIPTHTYASVLYTRIDDGRMPHELFAPFKTNLRHSRMSLTDAVLSGNVSDAVH